MWTNLCGPIYVDQSMWTNLCGPIHVDQSMWTNPCGPISLWTNPCGPIHVDQSMWTNPCGPIFVDQSMWTNLDQVLKYHSHTCSLISIWTSYSLQYMCMHHTHTHTHTHTLNIINLSLYFLSRLLEQKVTFNRSPSKTTSCTLSSDLPLANHVKVAEQDKGFVLPSCAPHLSLCC